MYPGSLTWTDTMALGNLPAPSGMDSVKMRKTPGKEKLEGKLVDLGGLTVLLVCVYL